MTDTIIPDDQHRPGDNPGAIRSPRPSKSKRSIALRVSLVVAVVMGVLMLVFRLVAPRADSEPTVRSLLQEQQRAFDQLSEEMSALQQHREAQARAQRSLKDQLGALIQRVDQLERSREDSRGENRLEQIEAVSTRLEELSASTDVRFSAVFETQKALEGAIHAADEEATAESAEEPAEPTTAQRSPSPPSPPFSIAGLERRGGRSYLAVTSGELIHLDDIRLLSEGEHLGQWQLSAINPNSASFTVNGQHADVPVP